MGVWGWRNCVGARTRLVPDAAAVPGWEEMTSDMSVEVRRGTGGEEERSTGWRGGRWRMDTELSQAVL